MQAYESTWAMIWCYSHRAQLMRFRGARFGGHFLLTYASFAPAPHRFNIFRKIFISVINSDLFARFDITRGVNHDATVFDLGLDIGLARMIDIAGKVVRDLPVDCPFSIYFKKIARACLLCRGGRQL